MELETVGDKKKALNQLCSKTLFNITAQAYIR